MAFAKTLKLLTPLSGCVCLQHFVSRTLKKVKSCHPTPTLRKVQIGFGKMGTKEVPSRKNQVGKWRFLSDCCWPQKKKFLKINNTQPPQVACKNGSSVGKHCTLRTRFRTFWRQVVMLSRRSSTRISASELRRKFIWGVRCWLGIHADAIMSPKKKREMCMWECALIRREERSFVFLGRAHQPEKLSLWGPDF